ncbi:MAG TPA: LPS assembly protein LptD [Candidatus Binataceae bacterium]
MGAQVCFLKHAIKSLTLGIIAAMFCLGAAASAWCAQQQQKGPLLPPSVHAEHEEPVNVTGKETIYDSKTDTYIVRGDAVMTQGPTILKADEIQVMRDQRSAHAVGHVHLIDPELELWASEAKINIVTETLELWDAKVVAKKDTYHLEGKKITKQEGQHYLIEHGFFTTCGDKGTPDWAVTADSMDVNVGSSGVARGAGVNILGYQVLKLPWAEFPAATDRHSGFLSGREGESGLRGFQWLQPYYIDINKSSDVTVAADVETSQRIGGLGEYRLTNGPDDYLWTDAAFYDESIRSASNREGDIVDNQIADPHIPVDRYGLIGMMRQHLTPDLMIYGDAVSVSDSLYLREMDVWTLSRGFGSNFGSLRNAPADFGLLDEYENGYAQLGGVWNQDLIQPQSFALQRLPDLTINGRTELLNNFAFLDYNAEAVDFYRYQGVDGLRMTANPKVTVPWRFGDYAYGYFAAGSYASGYDTSGSDVVVTPVGTFTSTCKGGKPCNMLLYNNALSLGPDTNHDRIQGSTVPYAQAGISTIVDRVWDVNWGSIEKLKNTIEPFANYAFVPRINQGSLPLFDQTDRINSRSLVTYGVTTRLFARMSRQEPEEDENSFEPSGQEAEENASAPPPMSENAPDSAIGPYNGQSEPGGALAPTGATTYSNGNEVQELAQLTLQQAYDTSHAVALNGSQISDIEGLLNVYPTKIASLGAQLDYNPSSSSAPNTRGGISLASVSLNFQPPWSDTKSKLFMGRAVAGSFLQMAYSYVGPNDAVQKSTTKNGSQFMSLRAYTDVLDQVGVYVAPSYDFASSQLLEAEYGVRLKSSCDCWAADFGLTQSYNPDEVQFQFQLTLGGLGSVGQTPFGRNPFQQMGLAGQPTGVLPRY